MLEASRMVSQELCASLELWKEKCRTLEKKLKEA